MTSKSQQNVNWRTSRPEGGRRQVVVKRYAKDPSVVYREIAGEAILVPIHHEVADMQSIYTLDSVGVDIWRLIDGKRTTADILDTLLGEYEVEPDILAKDLDEFIEQLASVGAIKAI
jgi:hypothetical protein